MNAKERHSGVDVVHGCFPEGGDSILNASSWEPLDIISRCLGSLGDLGSMAFTLTLFRLGMGLLIIQIGLSSRSYFVSCCTCEPHVYDTCTFYISLVVLSQASLCLQRNPPLSGHLGTRDCP